MQAFVQTAKKIYENIQSGVCDVSNESHGIKVGVSSNAKYLGGSEGGSGNSKGGGCC